MPGIRFVIADALEKIMPFLEVMQEKGDLIAATSVLNEKKQTLTLTVAAKKKKVWKHIVITVQQKNGLPKGLK